MVTLRVSVRGHLPQLVIPQREREGQDVKSRAQKGFRSAFLGNWRQVPVYSTDQLVSGAEIVGPAILESDFTTILVEEKDKATVDQYGGIQLLVSLGDEAETVSDEDHPDPITLAVVENRLESIALEMMEVMLRTAMSQILNSSRDFSTAILDADCQLVAQGEGIPVHISALPIAGAAVRDYFGEDIADGDLYALNDPYFGGSHLPDITVIRPIFYQEKLLFYSVNRAHHSDVGGGQPDHKISNITLIWMISQFTSRGLLDFDIDYVKKICSPTRNTTDPSWTKNKDPFYSGFLPTILWSFLGSRIRTPGRYRRPEGVNGVSRGSRTNEDVHL